jgi:hypothetical protein
MLDQTPQNKQTTYVLAVELENQGQHSTLHHKHILINKQQSNKQHITFKHFYKNKEISLSKIDHTNVCN